MVRLNSSAPAEGAEKLVEAELSLLGLITGQYPRNYPGIDLFAFTPERKDRRVDIQVKYRHARDSGTVDLSEFLGDFLVVVRGNQGYRYRKSASEKDDGFGPRDVWILPMQIARQLSTQSPNGRRWRIRCADLPSEYLNRFDLIVEMLRD